LIFLGVLFNQSSFSQFSSTSFQFEYVENLEPYRTFSCSHSQASVGLFEWDVVCNVDGQKKTFWVHLSLKKFKKSSWGENAYELLYWVTNSEAQTKHRHSSTSLWIHNSEKENQMRRLVSSLGIQEDDAYLRLTFDP
jgi:hypothetical protein